MNRIRFGREDGAKCASADSCFPLAAITKARQHWIHTHDLFLDDTGRVFALVDTATRVYFMDAITGSLYQFGECLTSDDLRVKSLVRDQEKATSILMSKTAEVPA